MYVCMIYILDDERIHGCMDGVWKSDAESY